MSQRQTSYSVELMGETSGHCDCCGNESRRVWGMVYNGDQALAAYWMHWTEGHLGDLGANLDLVMGRWGDETCASDRVAIALVHRQQPDGDPALMVVDAGDRPHADGSLASTSLRREDIIGTPLAAQVFALTDAIYEQDRRFF